MDSESFVRGVIAILGSTGGGAVLTWALNRRAQTAHLQAEKRDADLKRIETMSGAWAEFVGPIRAEVADLRGQVKELNQSLDEARIKITSLHREAADTERQLSDAVAHISDLLKWGAEGAPPPPPSVRNPRLRARIHELEE